LAPERLTRNRAGFSGVSHPFDSLTCRRAVWKDETMTYLHFTYTKANGYRDHTFFPMDAPIDAIKWFFAFLKDGRFEGPVTFQPDAPGT
jgi:hypothetical protein